MFKGYPLKANSLEEPLVADQTPRFVTCVNHDAYNGNMKEYSWDQEKIFVHECVQDDLLMLQNVFEGKIISPLVYPLIFEQKSPQKEISLRSLQFYKEVQNDTSLYLNLSSHEKNYFLVGLRDLFIGACRGLLSQDEKQMLVKIVELINPNDSNIVYKTINNMEVAPYPTASHKMVRFIEEVPEGESDNILEEFFVRNELGLIIGFVDPRDLSFHNFENIINLDSLFKDEEDFPISNFKKYDDNEVYTFDLRDSKNILLSLDKHGLYTQPINKLSRGGERFIFSSQVLGKNITAALKKYIPNEDLTDESLQFVNYVFRYNKFKPSDRKFTSHYDTPYHDPARQFYSKYTLILYLTPGTADPVLSLDNGRVNINTIENNNGIIKGVIFDQKYEHEGKSFIDSDKIFIRTELIYDYYYDDELSFDPEISRKFNIACYMTKESVFNPELEKYASDCFNQVAQARLNLAKIQLTKDILIYKKYHGVPFVTNGYDYWFQKNISLKTAALMTLLDYFGCKYKDHCGISWYKRPGPLNYDDFIDDLEEIEDVKDIFKFLQNQNNRNLKEEDEGDVVESLKGDCKQYDHSKLDTVYEQIEKYHCHFCGEIHPEKEQIKAFMEENRDYINSELTDLKESFTIFIFNNEIKIEKSKIKINSDTIVFDEKIPTVNFASCQFSVEYDVAPKFNKEEISVSGYANIPPIYYSVHDEGYHLKIELFNNGFVRNEEFEFDKYSY